MFFFKKYDEQNHVWSFMTKYLRFLCKLTSWSGETPTGKFSDVFLSWTRIMSVLILHLSIFYEYQQFFQHHICFSIQPQLQLVNLHRKRRYFVIKLHYNFMLVFKKYDRQNHVWSFMTKYLRFLCKFTSWSCGCIEKQIRFWKNCWYS
jgi:hypothetical protein